MRPLKWHNAIKPRQRRQIYEDVVSLSQPGGSFYVMVALSIIIAAYGLLISSAAVVIGAMLVAPLMGPIFGISLGLVSGNRRLLWRAGQSEGVGIVFSVGSAVLIGVLSAHIEIGPEWMARTQPTLYDLLIALASGLAGAYALIDEDVSPVLPGVAVAVALLPPLAACGLSVSAQRWDLAGGAAMLFAANFLAIQLAGAVVFSAYGMLRVRRERHRAPDEGAKLSQFLKRFGLSIIVLLIIAWFLTRTLAGLISEQQLSTTIQKTLTRQLATTTGARLSDVRSRTRAGQLEVTATVLTPRAFRPEDVADLEDALDEALDREANLIVRSLISVDVNREGTVFTTPDERASEAEAALRSAFMTKASRIVRSRLAVVPGIEVVDLRMSPGSDPSRLTAIVRAPRAVTPDEVQTVQRALTRELETPVRLAVETIPVAMTTAQGMTGVSTPAETSARAAASIEGQARGVVEGWVSGNVPGASLDGLTVTFDNGAYAIDVLLLTRRPLLADEAGALARELRSALGIGAQVSVRYQLGGEFAAE